ADGRTGLLVPPEDPDALAAALARLLAGPELGARLGAAAAHDARARFDVRPAVRRLEALYRRCLPFASGPPPLPSAAVPGPDPQEEVRCTESSTPPQSSPPPSSPPPAW
ncbi:MAG: hypothetical protein R3263_09715, partial [Myxococcota bacterium]|nr:hypothetical protein [Myxococcota bacterium]